MTLDLLTRFGFRQHTLSTQERALIQRRLYRGTMNEPQRLVEHRIAQLGRLQLRIRRAAVALEEALVALAESEVDRHD